MTTKKYFYQPKCECCGRFCSWDSDYYIPFGGPTDLEPDDPHYMCPQCIEKDIERIRSGKHGFFSHYINPDYYIPLAKELGYALAGPEVAGWSHWKKLGTPLPEDWVWREMENYDQPE